MILQCVSRTRISYVLIDICGSVWAVVLVIGKCLKISVLTGNSSGRHQPSRLDSLKFGESNSFVYLVTSV